MAELDSLRSFWNTSFMFLTIDAVKKTKNMDNANQQTTKAQI